MLSDDTVKGLDKMTVEYTVSADEAVEKLKLGNEKYLQSRTSSGDISPEARRETCENGQKPYAVIVTCSDSRVIPESIFSAGIGELFVIRVAGNVMDDHQLGSIEYAVEHLGIRLVAVLGHDHCGAVDAAINHDPEGYIKFITDEIKLAIGDEQDDYKACCLNVKRSVAVIESSFEIHREQQHGLKVIGALYRLADGRVEFDI
jgi:carbonic anhydrase